MGRRELSGDRDRGRRYWDAHVGAYDLTLRVLGRPFPRMLELMREQLDGCQRILEVGAGTGAVTLALARVGVRWLATDYSEEMVQKLRERARRVHANAVEIRQADIDALDLGGESFDAVVAANVLHLVPDLPGAFRALAKAVRPGGKILVPTFCHAQTLPARVTSRLVSLTGFPAQRQFTFEALVRDVKRAGLHVTRGELIPGLIPVGFIAATG